MEQCYEQKFLRRKRRGMYPKEIQRKALTPNDFPDLPTVAERLAAFERYYQTIARPFEWKFTHADLNNLLARMRQRYAEDNSLKLAA